jgi:SAM-dependent methyltransferase
VWSGSGKKGIEMDKHPQWPTAQTEEKNLWDGVVRNEPYIFRVLEANSQKAIDARRCLPRTPETSVEVGIGPLGTGISGFLQEIPKRYAVDPLPPVPLESPMESSEELRMYLRDIRAPIRYVRGCGEEMPIRSESMDLVICCNVLDHTSNPDAVLREIHRILKPEGLFYFDVDAFSMLGLVKWHSWTKYAHKDEILVTTHPYRMYEADVVRRLRSSGFQFRKLSGHTMASSLIGHFRVSTFLGSKCSP